MAGPSLSELTHVPARATGQPAAIIDNSNFVAQLNQNARFKAENDWKKYQQFLKNFDTLSQDAQTIAGLEIMPQDREYLDKERSKIFDIIYKNPRALSGTGPDAILLKEKMGKYMSDATRSKQDYAFDWAHRKLLGENPEWSSDENKKIIEDFKNKPLGERSQYTLNMPYMVDMSGLLQGVFKDPTVQQTTYGWEPSPDGKFIQEKTTTTIKHDPFMNRWNTGYDYQHDKYGRPISGYTKQLYDQLPENMKKQYMGKDGTPDLRKFWNDIGETMLGSKQDIVKTEKGKLEPNRFAVDEAKEKQKFLDDIKKMQIKFGYDMQKMIRGEGLKERFREFQQAHPVSGSNKTGRWLNQQTTSLIMSAQANGKPIFAPDNTAWGMSSQQKEVNWDPQVKHLFDEEAPNFQGKMVKRGADLITVDGDGNIHVTFYKKGTEEPDENLSHVVAPDDFKALLANKFKMNTGLELSNQDLIDAFGTPSLNGNINSYWQHMNQGAPDDDEKPKGTGKKSEKVEDLRKKYDY